MASSSDSDAYTGTTFSFAGSSGASSYPAQLPHPSASSARAGPGPHLGRAAAGGGRGGPTFRDGDLASVTKAIRGPPPNFEGANFLQVEVGDVVQVLGSDPDNEFEWVWCCVHPDSGSVCKG